jgi:hypothetical protein
MCTADMLNVVFNGLTAVFTGIAAFIAAVTLRMLIKSLEPHLEMSVNRQSADYLVTTLHIDNRRGYATFFADKIRADQPRGLRISFASGGSYDTDSGIVSPPVPIWSDSLEWSISVAPGKTCSETFLLSVPEGRRAERTLLISVQVSIRRHVMPYKTKTITAMLVDNTNIQKV